MWPALARASAVRRPKPPDAPVTSMILLITDFLVVWAPIREERAQSYLGSDDSAVGAQRLAVDPGAVGAGEEGDGGGDVRRLAEALQRGELGEAVDDFLRERRVALRTGGQDVTPPIRG
jgi:hypothetical protein